MFISIRWRLTSPLFLVVLIIFSLGAFVLARNLANGVRISQENLLLKTSQTITERATQLYETYFNVAQSVAFTMSVPDAVIANDPQTLKPILESYARLNDLDSIIVTNSEGQEILGIQRVNLADVTDYAVNTGTDLSREPILRAILNETLDETSGFMLTPSGMMIFTAVPIFQGDLFSGVVLVGQNLDTFLQNLQNSVMVDLAFYSVDGHLIQTTLQRDPSWLALDSAVFNQALNATNQIPLRTFDIETDTYQATYQPFQFGGNTLGVVGVFMRDNIPYVTETGKQITALMAAALMGFGVTAVFVGASYYARQAEKITDVAQELTTGKRTVRTNMSPTDEISAVGHALDQYADYVQTREDEMIREMRRQRREFAHVIKVIQSLPDGVIVQDTSGRVILMNDMARTLLGTQRFFSGGDFDELTQQVPDVLGKALAPGLYALGDPHRLTLDERILQIQVAAIVSSTDRRLGTVMMLRDISDQVRKEGERDAMFQRLAWDIQQPLAQLGRLGMTSKNDMMQAFARQVVKQAVALQRMIIDMREMAVVDSGSVQRRQQPLPLETLIWSIANEWRQIAAANDLTMHVMIEKRGLFVLGDEKRLRWAIGNIIDNAIKYTLPGGALTLEIKPDSDGMANLRIRDNGVGILKEERNYIFTRFYRGTPTSLDGQIIRVPGMGQGLFIARQIIEAHGGTIKLKSTQGVGTAVYLSLPLTSGYEITYLEADMEGETVRLPESLLTNLDEM